MNRKQTGRQLYYIAFFHKMVVTRNIFSKGNFGGKY